MLLFVFAAEKRLHSPLAFPCHAEAVALRRKLSVRPAKLVLMLMILQTGDESAMQFFGHLVHETIYSLNAANVRANRDWPKTRVERT